MASNSRADKPPKAHPALLSFLSGSIAGGVEASITYPVKFAKTRVQLRKESGKVMGTEYNPFFVIRDIFRQEGFRALYTGCSALIVGSVAKDGIRFLTFDGIKSAFKDPETGTLTPLRSLLAGMSAGVMSSTFASTTTERVKVASSMMREGKSDLAPREVHCASSTANNDFWVCIVALRVPPYGSHVPRRSEWAPTTS